jgi:diguanylate cyclase (GGDEF)-like protein
MAARKVLVINQDSESNYIIRSSLLKEKYDAIFVNNEAAGIEKAESEKPDLILVNTNSIGIDGFRISHKLKENAVTRFIPLIALVDIPDTLTGKVSSIEAEGLLIKPFNPESLKSEIQKILKTTAEHLSANPLTKLPGGFSIEENVTDRIKKKEKFAVLYLDLNDFKPYNDYYGFYKGDQVIRLLGNILIDASKFKGSADDFVGHIGGDDFVLVTIPEKATDICNYVIENFDKGVRKYYDQKDLAAGYIVTKDRKFQTRNFPVMSIAIAVATNENREIDHYGKIIDILVEMKKYVKSHKEDGKSSFAKDRRTETRVTSKPKNRDILIVEDDESVSELLKFAIEKNGFRTKVASDGNKALELLKTSIPDLIVMDMMMPGKSGLEVIRELQAKEFSSIPIVVVSGGFADNLLWKTVRFEPNVKDYMEKPIQPGKLINKINSILGIDLLQEKKLQQ